MRCRRLLEMLRVNARFILKLPQTGDKLPHNMEIRVQAGGLSGIQQLFEPAQQDTIADVHALLEQSEAEFGRLEDMPYDRIVQSIRRFEGRKSRKRS